MTVSYPAHVEGLGKYIYTETLDKKGKKKTYLLKQ